MSALVPSRTPDLRHHVLQGTVWLRESDQGANTSALSYAAFEFRLAIERLAVHYWAQLLGRRPEVKDFRDISSFKRVERRIYEFGGHQKEINGHFKFMQIVLSLLAIRGDLATPNLRQLSKNWHECSKLCHISWTLTCSVPQARTDAFGALQAIQNSLTEQVNGLASWPKIHEPTFADLRDRYVAGEADSNDVKAYLKKKGAWTRIKYKDGRPSVFVGEPIAPSEGTESK